MPSAGDILGVPEVGQLIDFSQPVAVLARTRDEISAFVGDLTLAEPGLTGGLLFIGIYRVNYAKAGLVYLRSQDG